MTKKEMIKTIQEKEASNWKDLEEWERLFGEKHDLTKRARCQWAVVYGLMDELGIAINRGEA